jgi:hypothetical protein
VNRRRQPAFVVMPDKLPDFTEHVRNGGEGGRPIHLGFEPLPATLERIILWGIRLQMFQGDPGVLLEKLFDRATLVHLGIVEDDDKQRLGEPLVELVEEGQHDLRGAPRGSLPVAALGTQMEGPDHRGALALGRGGHFGVGACAKPPASDIRLIRKV